MNFSYFLLIASFLFSVTYLKSQVNSEPGTESEVILQTNSGNLSGSLLLPSNNNKIPVVLIIAGSGPTDRNGNNPQMVNNSLKMLAQSLADSGIASLRYDKRGIGQSSGAMVSESELRFEHLVQDASDWIMLLKNNPNFTKVIVAGHSEGSLIGMLAAKKAGADAFISLAGIADNASKILKDQIAAGSPLFSEASNKIIDSLVSGQEVQNVHPLLTSLFRKSVQPYLISWFRYTPKEEIQKLNIPVLIVQGTHDIQVATAEGRALHKAYPASIYHEVEGMNHILKDAPSERFANLALYSKSDVPLHPDLMPAIISFIRRL